MMSPAIFFSSDLLMLMLMVMVMVCVLLTVMTLNLVGVVIVIIFVFVISVVVVAVSRFLCPAWRPARRDKPSPKTRPTKGNYPFWSRLERKSIFCVCVMGKG